MKINMEHFYYSSKKMTNPLYRALWFHQSVQCHKLWHIKWFFIMWQKQSGECYIMLCGALLLLFSSIILPPITSIITPRFGGLLKILFLICHAVVDIIRCSLLFIIVTRNNWGFLGLLLCTGIWFWRLLIWFVCITSLSWNE